MADRLVPQKMSSHEICTGELLSSMVSSKLAARISGMDSKKENRAEAFRLIPINSAAVIVIPEREVPGIRARAWAKPINRIIFRLS